MGFKTLLVRGILLSFGVWEKWREARFRIVNEGIFRAVKKFE